MILRISFSSLLSLILIAGLLASSTRAQENRSADAAAIRAHIESIFQAFIDGDIDKIYATHSEDWRGLLEGTRAPIKGIDDYMRANGIEWPRPANAPKSTPYYPTGTSYRVSDFDVHFYSPDLGVASFVGEFVRNIGDATVTMRRFRIMDVYAKRKGSWIQVASHTAVDPEWRMEQMSQPQNVTSQIRQQVLNAREAVWKAWFANDRQALDRLIPEEAIAIDAGPGQWSNRAMILAQAKRFADSGSRLVKLEFPKTEMQIYGPAIIVYTTYLYEIETDGKRVAESGRATEIFVRRGKELVNTGWHMDSVK